MKFVHLALLGYVSAEQIMKLEQVSDENICTVACPDKLTCCPEDTVCGDGDGQCYPKNEKIPAQILTKKIEKPKPVEEAPVFDTDVECAKYAKDFSKQNDWWLLTNDPFLMVYRMEVEEKGEDWGMMKIKHTDWEMKYWINGTMVSEIPVGNHLGEEPQGDMQCDPRTGAFWA